MERSATTAPEAPSPQTLPDSRATRWYAGVTRYQWLVLVIASAGWVFDAFEGQVFNLTRQDLLRELVGSDLARQKWWGDFFLAAFLLGGTVGGIGFGALADRFGRKPTMSLTILFYAVFSGLTYFAASLWQVAVLRFMVALGVGGEWAVAASIVAEVFPARARARAGGIFHATSVTGIWLAALVGLLVGTHWRYAYLAGLAPALLVLSVRASLHEPQRWREVREARAVRRDASGGSLRELFSTGTWARRAVFGLLLAGAGLGTFWGVFIAGQDLTRELLVRAGLDPTAAATRAKFAYGIVQTAGFAVGLLAFGPAAERLGRRGAFLLWHLAAVVVAPATCYLPQTYGQMLAALPVFGFFAGGMHAGYAIYFPELFPTRLRATGAGVCFNGGRLVAAPLLWISAELKALPGVDLRLAVTMLSALYLVGAALLVFLPETRGRPLPE